MVDEINSLTYAPDLAAAVKKLLDDKKTFGISYNYSGSASWFDFAGIFRIINKQIILEPVGSTEFKASQAAKKGGSVEYQTGEFKSWQGALKNFVITIADLLLNNFETNMIFRTKPV